MAFENPFKHWGRRFMLTWGLHPNIEEALKAELREAEDALFLAGIDVAEAKIAREAAFQRCEMLTSALEDWYVTANAELDSQGVDSGGNPRA